MLYHILLSLGCISFQSIGMLSIIILLLAFVSSVALCCSQHDMLTYCFILISNCTQLFSLLCHRILITQGLEKYIMTKLFSRTFAISPEDVKIDQEISEKIHLLQSFLRPEHLDIPPFLQNEASWLVCVLAYFHT